ncbi:DoxX family protein [Gilvibacter sp. SZ-19]|uniref:DoxX family protein n=1 Tax=unclassified Gilvibacter TaxID=2625242 RepID=UPI000B3D21AB|nr:DoxX family protein [Gilvibacter sp. SZ-19]ARV11704.1 DoxX family protein [Gilvibacter sp. SZ-19]
MKNTLKKLIRPVYQHKWYQDALFALPRIVGGLLLTIDFGSSKFGMPWSPPDKELGLFEVVDWFPEDVKAFGGIFALAPTFFAWMAAASEAIGGVFWALGLNTRMTSFLIMCTMLTAIFFQKWGEGTWGMLPAMGFLWIAIFTLVLGSGRFGLDALIAKRFDRK